MIEPESTYFWDALARPHNAYTRVEVWRRGARVATLDAADVTNRSRHWVFLDGQVQATLTNRVTRQLTLVVPESLYPWNDDDLLAPYGNHIRAFRGIRYGNRTVDEMPVFTGPILSVAPAGNTVTLTCADLASDVSRAGFARPRAAFEGTLILSEFEALVSDALPDAVFGTHDPLWERVPVLNYEHDRGQALDALAEAASSFWYTLADGRFVIRRVPWAVQRPAVVHLRSGPGGTVIDAHPLRTNEGVFNRITVIGDRRDGAAPVFYTADDRDPSSPTWVEGPYGVKAKQYTLTSILTDAVARSTANALLAAARSRRETWTVSCVPDPSIELGDVVSITHRGHEVTQVVAAFSMPLVGGSMTLQCRSSESGGLEEAD